MGVQVGACVNTALFPSKTHIQRTSDSRQQGCNIIGSGHGSVNYDVMQQKIGTLKIASILLDDKGNQGDLFRLIYQNLIALKSLFEKSTFSNCIAPHTRKEPALGRLVSVQVVVGALGPLAWVQVEAAESGQLASGLLAWVQVAEEVVVSDMDMRKGMEFEDQPCCSKSQMSKTEEPHHSSTPSDIAGSLTNTFCLFDKILLFNSRYQRHISINDN
jgi:hypothetical protein